jgi:hypothetical protein
VTRLALSVILLLLGVTGAQAQTGQPVITFGTPGSTTVPMTINWVLAPGATNHVIDGGLNDNTGYFTVTQPGAPVNRPMPYHVTGAAATGWTCVTATVGGATIASACNGYTVPAKPTAATTTHTVTFTEAAKNADGTPLTDLASSRVYWRVDAGPETMITMAASSPSGAANRTYDLTIPYTSGTLNVQATSVDTGGLESVRTPVATKPIGGGAPTKGTISVTTITQ